MSQNPKAVQKLSSDITLVFLFVTAVGGWSINSTDDCTCAKYNFDSHNQHYYPYGYSNYEYPYYYGSYYGNGYSYYPQYPFYPSYYRSHYGYRYGNRI